MGNTQFADILINFSEKFVSQESLSDSYSLFDLKKNDKDIYVKNSILNIDYNSSLNPCFIQSTDNNNARLLKDNLKYFLASEIYKVQNSKEFNLFIKKLKISSSVELLNRLNSCIEDNFTPSLILNNVASLKIDSSSAFIDFSEDIKTINYFKTYSKKNLQTYYIAKINTLVLDIFIKKDVKTSKIGGYIKQSLENDSKIYSEVLLIFFLVIVLIIIFGMLLYFKKPDIIKNTYNNFLNYS